MTRALILALAFATLLGMLGPVATGFAARHTGEVTLR